MFGQLATEEKSDEITGIPLLLKHLDLKGALVTMDAMGTQTDIARAIRDGGGDYCMSLKKNWPAVYADVEQLFNDPPEDIAFETNETTDLTAGRIETRRHTVCHKVDWMTSDRRYPGEPVFPDLAMVGRIETEVERNGKTEHETRYYLCSLALCALTFARAVRAHWGVENRLHWVLDVVLDRVPRRGVRAWAGRCALRRAWPVCQSATAGKLTMASSLKGAMVSSVM